MTDNRFNDAGCKNAARSDLPDKLATRLRSSPTPAPRGFSPPMSFGRHHGPPRPDARAAAVILVLQPGDHGWWLPVTLRPDHLSAHAGQICLPGGALEPGESPLDAALREVEEELGYSVSVDQIVGQLAPLYVFNSNFLIHPFVACSRQRLQLIPNPAEVSEVIRLPVAQLFCHQASEPLTIQRGHFEFTAPALRWRTHRIWGATRVIIADFARHVATC